MKIIHTADVHLDSPLAGVADGKLRRRELLRALSNVAEYAKNNGVQAVIVAGDLFDENSVSSETVKQTAQIISSVAEWFILRGNHGGKGYDVLKNCPNAHFFGEDWSYYTRGGVTIVGRELGVKDDVYWQKFSPPKDTYNVLVLHGDVADDSYGKIDKKVIAASKVDYVALGHRHEFSAMNFGTVRACYCGVPEARGFDEGKSGFVVLDTDKNQIKFVESYLRRVEKIAVDVSAAQTPMQAESMVMDAVSGVSPQNYLDLTLKGKVRCTVDARMIRERLDGRFFALRISDKTAPDVDIARVAEEISLRGEFVRLAMQLPEERRDEVLHLGFAALDGEL